MLVVFLQLQQLFLQAKRTNPLSYSSRSRSTLLLDYSGVKQDAEDSRVGDRVGGEGMLGVGLQMRTAPT